jgi:alkylhydroperoxidase family enzyme
MAGKETLEYALRSHAVPLEEMHSRYPAVIDMVRRILGLTPRCDGYLEIWPPAFTTYNVLVPSLMDVPKCDLGLGIPPRLRSLVAHAASRGYGCPYCVAHTAVMGTVFKGPCGTLDLNAKVSTPEGRALLTDGEAAAVDVGEALGRVPAAITAELRGKLASHFDEQAEERIVLAATMMGFLNRFMDTLGVVLEWEALTMAEEHLAPNGWTPRWSYEEKYDAELVQRDREERDKLAGTREGGFHLASTIAGCIAYDRNALRDVPGSAGGIAARFRAEAGFVPYHMERLPGAARRALGYAVLERLNKPGDQIPVWLKHAMCFVAASHAENGILRAHAAFLAARGGAKVQQLVDALDADRIERAFPEREAAALLLAHAAKGNPSRVEQALIDRLVAHFTPASIIELLVVLSVHSALQRYSAVFPPAAYEPEIVAFVGDAGSTLQLAASPLDAEQRRFDEAVAASRPRGRSSIARLFGR